MTDVAEQEMSDLFDEVEVEKVEPEPEMETEVIEEPVDEPEPEPEIDSTKEVPEAVEEEPVTPDTEEFVDEQPGVDDLAGDDTVDDELVEDDLVQLKEQNAALLERIESLSGQVISGVAQPQVEPQVVEPKTAQPAQAPVPQTVTELQNYLGDVSIDDLLEDPTKFNAVLNNVAQQSQQAATQGAVQQVLRSVPELVMGYITRHSAMNRMVDDFYKENPDLDSVKQTVAAVANDVHAKNPQLGVEEVFKQSAEQTRKLLGMKKTAQNAVAKKRQKPAFAKAGGVRKSAPKVSAVQSEINNLLLDDF